MIIYDYIELVKLHLCWLNGPWSHIQKFLKINFAIPGVRIARNLVQILFIGVPNFWNHEKIIFQK